MSHEGSLTGQCLCGAVHFSATPKNKDVGVCHCSMCRRWSGGPLMVLDCGDRIQYENQSGIGVYKSSEWGERGFCKKCGTALFWKLQGKDHYIVPVDAFDDPGDLKFASEIFIEEKPAYYDFANETHKMTGEEVFAMFAEAENGG